MPKAEKKGRKPAKRDEHGRFVSPVNGQPVPEGKPFRTGDERAKQAGIASGIARKEKGDLRRLCQLWMEEEVATGKDGEKITGGQMMVRVAVKEVAKAIHDSGSFCGIRQDSNRWTRSWWPMWSQR